jgi:hypothetical protein
MRRGGERLPCGHGVLSSDDDLRSTRIRRVDRKFELSMFTEAGSAYY